LSPADKAAVTWQSQGSLASAFDSLQQSAANRAARSNNSAGFGELTDELARQKGIAEGKQAQQNQLAFSNTAFQRQMAALQGLSGLFGVDSNLLRRTLGIPQLLSVRANASRPSGFSSSLGQSAGSPLSASEAYARGFSWGLMQLMGQVAREAGFDPPFLSTLCDPEKGLVVGCKVLRKKLDALCGDTLRGLLAWNGGANPAYPAKWFALGAAAGARAARVRH
jgi:hypothetical protein